MKKIFFLLLFFSAFTALRAQDYIRTKTDTIKSKVLEIGIDEIKYRNFNNPDGPVIVIPKTSVIEITYENGSKYFLAPDPYDVNKEVEVRGKTHAIKFEFFSPLTNDIAFGFEKMLKVGTNIEFKVAIIGPGTRPNNENASGFFFKGGVKFLKTPSYVMNGMKYSHGLAGAYIKPEFIFNNYSTDSYYTNYTTGYYQTTKARINYTNLCLDICFGKQYILGNIITLDYYVGFGYGLKISNRDSNSIYDDGNAGYAYSHEYFGSTTPLILTGGLTIGVLY